MIHFKPFLKTKYRKKSGQFPIYIQFNSQNKVTTRSLGISVSENSWHSDKLRVTSKDPLHLEKNKKITRAVRKCYDIEGDFDKLGKVPSLNEFLLRYDDKLFGNKSFYEYALNYAERRKVDLRASTRKTMMDNINKVNLFRPGVSLNEIDHKFILDYEYWLKTERKNNKNTIRKTMGVLRQILIHAIKEGVLLTSPFANYTIGSIEGTRRGLDKTEVERLQQLYKSGKLKPNKQNVLRYFLFACFTGLRYSDVRTLQKRHIVEKEVNGSTRAFIDKVSVKTMKRIYNPLTSEALALVPSNIPYEASKVFRVLTDQPTNRYLKEIFKAAKIKISGSFHYARHTFATLCREKGISSDVIRRYMGDINSKTLNVYAGFTDQHLVNEIDKWQ